MCVCVCGMWFFTVLKGFDVWQDELLCHLLVNLYMCGGAMASHGLEKKKNWTSVCVCVCVCETTELQGPVAR